MTAEPPRPVRLADLPAPGRRIVLALLAGQAAAARANAECQEPKFLTALETSSRAGEQAPPTVPPKPKAPPRAA